MLGALLAAFVPFTLVSYLNLEPIVDCFRDPKGLRRYPSLNCFSPFTGRAFIWEAHQGFRSKALLTIHQKHPVVRIGPKSLSYGVVKAVKDIDGHNTKCLKDVFYTLLSGTHYHLADLVDNPEHARKRKVLSSAYALKNLERWGHKVADKTERLMRGFDARCTAPLSKKYTRPDSQDLTVDYRSWTNFFTLDAIADIGLSERLGFLDAGNDKVVAERMDGSLHEVNYRECLHATARAQSGLVWAYEWYPQLQTISSTLSKQYRRMWKLNNDWNDIDISLE
ncbi:MAG: hypothetical protein M1830_008594 [Pleopsidium flavum]|nr:MAG: hypothetical protein M1830_008594 [Pleopsidium flavum]